MFQSVQPDLPEPAVMVQPRRGALQGSGDEPAMVLPALNLAPHEAARSSTLMCFKTALSNIGNDRVSGCRVILTTP